MEGTIILNLSVCIMPNRLADQRDGRDQDRLVFYLTLEGNAPLSVENKNQIFVDLSRLFFRTPGSVTAALKATAEELNRVLLDRNLKLGSNRQCIGHLIQVVLRENRLIIAQSGPFQIHRIEADGVTRIDIPELAGSGLGISKSGAIHFSRSTIQPNDVVLFSAKSAPEWVNEILHSVHGQGPETLRRRLYYQTKADINALAFQVKQGNGKFLVIRSGDAQPVSHEQVTITAPVVPVNPLLSTTALVKSVKPANEAPAVSLPTPVSVDHPVEHTKVVIEPFRKTSDSKQPGIQIAEQTDIHRKPGSIFSKLLGSLGVFGRKAADSLKVFIGRMLPDKSFLNIPSGLMAAIAILVPVAVVIAASSVYFRLGRSAQFELLTSQAEQLFQRANNQTDVGEKRADLGSVLSLLRKADAYTSDSSSKDELEAKLSNVRNTLDELDLVKRVNYQPAIIGGLQLNNKIIEMQAVDDQLYLLDKLSSRVLRAYLTDKGYEIDYTFQCSSGNYGEIQVGPIVEIIAWPAGYKPQASLLAVDGEGNVLYCQPDQSPTAERLVSGEGEGWGNILDATLDQGDFYALDMSSNGVWIYWRADFNEQPTLFFDEQIPPLQNVVDMLVDRDDLYLLQQDGRLIICARETLVVSPTRCQYKDFIDRRPGRENLPFTPATPLTQITYTAPPDPSLYLLESASHAVYHFSLRNLAMQKQLLPEQLLPSNPATAFAVNQERRMLYLAIGSQVYYATIP